jgi:hypothetical protein
MEGASNSAYFLWQWIWSTDSTIMVESHQKFCTEADCHRDADRCKPHYTTWDGPDAPGALLVITPYDEHDKLIKANPAESGLSYRHYNG